MNDLTVVHLAEDKTYTCPIYLDDTIDHVKSKLSALFPFKNLDEMYLFAREKRTLDPYECYKALSAQNTKLVTYDAFATFCLNHAFPLPVQKDSYDLSDFLALPTDTTCDVPIGVTHSPFVVNPFQNRFDSQEDSGTCSKSLWLSIEQETVYVCFAREVYAYSTDQGLEISKVFNVYYPYLFKEDRLHPDRFIMKAPNYTEYNNLMEFQHSIYKPNMILNHGIVSLYFVMYTLQPFSFPLDIFFKLYQSSPDCPYIKLHGTRSNENVYRFYCDQMSENGYPIPRMRKKAILKHAHEIHKNSISYVFPDKDIPVSLQLDKKGHLYVRLDQIPFLSVEAVEPYLQKILQGFMERLFEYFDPSHKIFTPFEHLHQSNVALLDMKYRCQYKKEGKLNIKKYLSCFSPLFNFMNEKEIITLRYKRVSNYNESQSKDAYLIEAFNQNITMEEIIHVFSANFMKHDEKAATEYVHQFFSTMEIEEKQNNLKRVKINPGFLVEIEKREHLEATVHSIDHIGYIPFVKLYLTNLVLVSQGIISDEGRCKKIKEIVIQEIKPVQEEGLLDFGSERGSLESIDTDPLEDPLEDTDLPDITPDLSPELPELSPDISPDLPEMSPIRSPPTPESNELPELSPDLSETTTETIPETIPETKSEPNVEPNVEAKAESSIESTVEGSVELPELSPDLSPDLPESPDLPDLSPELPESAESLESQESAESLESQESPESLESPELPDLSPNSNTETPIIGTPIMKGGAFSPTKKYDVFVYDLDPYTLQQKFNRDPSREAKVVDYFRAFQGSSCTLVAKEQETCKGFILEMSGDEMDYFQGNWIRIEYFDKPGNSYDGYTYMRDPQEWTDHPVVQFVKKVYASVSYGWNHKQDDKDEMYIYDIHNELKARYNGKYYVKLDEAEELTKIQFTPVNPLLKRLQEREPTLFTKTDTIHNQYSRMCLWSEKRQPIILTKEEKERIDEISPGSYESAIEYGTDPKKPYFYICPKYWDLKNNIPVRADQVDPTKLISRDSSDSDKQKHIQSRYILELAKPGEKPVYQTRVGFLTKKHPSGYYMPCCFISKPKKEKPDAIDTRIQEALQYYQRKAEPAEKVSDYIQNGDKFPLPENRKGHLPPILETFFNLKYSDCYSQLQKRKLKVNYPCLLRQGVHEDQPFLSALSFLYFQKSVPTSTFVKVLLEKITLDNIQTFHNGGIVHTFSKDYENQKIEAYKDTVLYRTLDHESLKRIVNGYENFRKYLTSNDVIDYTYLWDIVTTVLFKKRVNMVVLKEGLEDVTHNLQIVCPTTAHATYSFQASYPSLLIYQRGDLFEPLFVFKKTETADQTITLFDLSEKLPTVNEALRKIYDRIGPACREKTVHSTYTFRENLYLHELLEELKKVGYTVEKQVMNIDGRIFGVLVQESKKDLAKTSKAPNPTLFVPCRPSAMSGDYILVDDSLWHDYNTTVYGLRKLAELSKGRIPCLPKVRVLETQLVVGILTETNQMVPLKAPEENKMKDDLVVLDEERRLVDRQIQKGKLDPKEKVIQSLKLEQMFYHAFFNTMKVALNDAAHLGIRKKVERAIQTKDMTQMKEAMEPLIEKTCIFVDDYAIDVYELQHVNLCKEDGPYCEGGKLLLPKVNLFHQGDNSLAYPSRFLDDFLMNVHVQRILLEEIHSTLYYTDRYQLTDHEILLLESELAAYLEKEPVRQIKAALYPLLEDVPPQKILEYIDRVEPVEEKEPIVFDPSELEEPEDEPEGEPTEQMELLEQWRDPEPVEEPVEEPADKPDEPADKPDEPTEDPVEEVIDEPVDELANEPEEPEPADEPEEPEPIEEPEEPESPEPIPASKPETKPSIKPETKPVKASKPIKLAKKSVAIKSAKLIRKDSEESFDGSPIDRSPIGTSLNGPRPKKINLSRIQEDLIPCIKTFYFKKNSKWKTYFPPHTIGFRIMKGDTYDTAVTDVKCNFIMALQILRDYHEKYKALTIRGLKDLLIEGYTILSQDHPLEKKFKKEKKRYKKWEDIQSEHYPFTEIDLLVLMIQCQLPMVVFIQAKNKLKLITYHTEDNFKYYIKMKKKDTFMLFIYDHAFKINRTDMDALYDAERDSVYLSDPEQRKAFFEKY